MANTMFTRGDAGATSFLESNWGYASGTTPLRQSMIGTDDIQDPSTVEAGVMAEINTYENMLAQTDAATRPMKIALIKAKLAELHNSLANIQAGASSAGAMEALQSDRMQQSAGAAGADMASWGGKPYETRGFYGGEMGFGGFTDTDYARSPVPNAPYSQFNISQYAPTYDSPSYQSPMGYNPPAWMRGYLAQGGQVRPLGMQDQTGALQQSALWEQQTMRDVGSIEQYLEREPYISIGGEEMQARSRALGPKTYGRRAQWEKALQR